MMKQAYLERVGSLTFRQLPVPAPGPGELLVRIHTALTCGTDLKTFRGVVTRYCLGCRKFPSDIEAAGIVEAVGDGVTKFSVGDAVVWAPTAGHADTATLARGWLV